MLVFTARRAVLRQSQAHSVPRNESRLSTWAVWWCMTRQTETLVNLQAHDDEGRPPGGEVVANEQSWKSGRLGKVTMDRPAP